MSLFTAAKLSASKGTVKKNEKLTVEVDSRDFHKNVKRYGQLVEELSDLQAEKAMLYGEIRETGLNILAEEYRKKGSFPGSMHITSQGRGGTAGFDFIPTDRYKTIDEEGKDSLANKFGADVVQTDVGYSFDSKVVAKYLDVISNLIQASPDISDVDKGRLIKATVKHSVRKGLIKSLAGSQQNFELLQAVQPICYVKNVQLTKSKSSGKSKKSAGKASKRTN